MNKVIKTSFIALLVLFSFICSNVNAEEKYERYKGSKNAKAEDSKKKLSDKDQATANQACIDRMGMDIDVGKYDRTADIGGNTVNPRSVTIKINKGTGEYKYQMYITDYDKFESIQACYKNRSECSIKTGKINTDDASYTGTTPEKIPAGKEAQIVVYPTNNSESFKITSESGKKIKVYCRGNKINEKTKIENTEELDGNVVTEFVQNPKTSVLIKNARKGTDVCVEAEQGMYTDSDGEKHSIKDVADKYPGGSVWTDYFNHIIGPFCTEDYVPFNLTTKQIKSLTRRLVKLYKKIKPLEINSTANIEEEFNRIISEYGITEDHIYTDANKNKLQNIVLDCNYETKNADYKNYMTYMYQDKSETYKATVYSTYEDANAKKNGKSIDVCRVGCYEVLKVTYDKPVAIKAGLCFSYKVTISSNMKCSAQLGDGSGNGYSSIVAKITPPKTGSAIPICKNGHRSAQAGPNEEFDSCVNECDNGKYTQECINECYNKVYEKDAKKTGSKSNKNSVKKVADYTKNSIVDKSELTLMANTDDYEKDFSCLYGDDEYKYYEEANAKKCGKKTINCDTAHVRSNLDLCAKFYTLAKALYPYGSYVKRSDGGVRWKSDDEINKKNYEEKDGIVDIPLQIAIASPFYMRDEEATKKLLIDLTQTYGRKYSISAGIGKGDVPSNAARGIKRQYRSTYHCKEYCYYDADAAALTPKEYVYPLKESLDNIDKELEKCSAATECNKDQKTVFNISVDNTRVDKSENKIKMKVDYADGYTETEKTTPSGNTDMFVIGDIAEDRDADLAKPSKDNTNGILGLCFNKEIEPYKYRTTITFPASYVNVKTGAVCWKTNNVKNITPDASHPCDTSQIIKNGTASGGTGSAHIQKDGYFCTARDSDSVNEQWWSYKKENGSLDGFKNNEKWNINATATKFGKYGWNIKFRCFYSIYNKACLNCKNDDGTVKKNEDTSLTNFSFKIVDTNRLFTAETANNENRIGYNWTANAQNTYLLTEGTPTEEAKTYAINPQKYADYVANNPANSATYANSNSSVMYHFVITKEKIKELKRKNSEDSYTEFEKTYYTVNGVEDLLYYRSNYIDELEQDGTLADTTRHQVMGKNNLYNNLASLLVK